MGIVYRLQTEVELKSTAEEFYNVLKNSSRHIPAMVPHHIQEVQLHEGEWESDGSVRSWTYPVDGRVEIYKEKIELNDEKKVVKFIGVDGDALKKYYKTLNLVYELTPKGSGSVVVLSLEYEKIEETSPAPEKYLGIVIGIAKGIDAHLAKK